MGRVQLPVIDEPHETGSIRGDGGRPKIVPADVRGRFARGRIVAFVVLIALWIALPLIHIGGAPAVFLDVEHRQFFLFGATFNAQDSWLVFFLLSGLGFGLVFVTAVAGRVWCGWACPQTVFLEGIYRRIERLVEGSRDVHLRRDRGPLTWSRVLRKLVKHVLFVVASLAVAHIVLAYFVSIPRTFAMVRSSPGEHPEAFAWVAAVTLLCYVDFGWFREQFCVAVCPYGRMQSVLIDDDSLVVGYDTKRGEPRGKKGTTEGDCVDCKRCVVVCPTAIDIRDGLQLDCIGCTACIDACDEVMDKLERPRGLIRYASTNELTAKPSTPLLKRPRILIYSVATLVGAVVLFSATRHRTSFEVLASRLPGPPYTIEGDELRNAFDLHLSSKRGQPAVFDVVVEPSPDIEAVVPIAKISVEPLGSVHAPVFLTMPRARFHGDTDVRIRIVREGSDEQDAVELPIKFLGAKS